MMMAELPKLHTLNGSLEIISLRLHIHLSIARSFSSNLTISVFLGAIHLLSYSMALLTQLPFTLFPMF